MHLQNKKIVITGGGGLIGKALASACLFEGANVTILDINKDAVDDLKSNENIESLQFIQCDLTDENIIKETVANLSNIDGWVNNAYPRTKDWGLEIDKVSMKSWSENIDLHLNSYFLCSKIVAEKMQKNGGGSIINMASIYGFLGPDFTVYEGTKMGNTPIYSAIKGGVINFTRYMAAFYGPDNVRVNSISPGGVFDNQPEQFVKQYEKKVPLKRMARAEDISGSVTFLLSDASAYVTGHNLVVDGGWSIV